MKASVVTCRDPFRPSNHRSVSIVRRRKSLRNLAPRTKHPTLCQVNGKWISQKAWAMRVSDGDSVVFVTLPQGGGGGSNPLKMVLMLAVSMYAPFMADKLALGFMGGSAAVGGIGVTGWSSIFTGAVGLVGSALVNALIPAAKTPKAQAAASLAAASPTYSLGSQGNTARLGQPIPTIYGRHMVYPDFGALPYTEYAGNEQYLYQLFVIGQGDYDIESIRVEDTPVSSFEEITTEIVPPGGTVTLFPTHVVTSEEVSGQEALTDEIIGPFVAVASGDLANYLAFDVVASRGLYYANDSGTLSPMTIRWREEAQLIDDDGVAIGSWVTLGSQVLTKATTTPQRRSNKYAVTLGRYQSRLVRTDTKQTDSRYGHELNWAGLRAYLPGDQQYGDLTLVAMKLRATNNLSAQASRKINMIVQRKLPAWNPATGWGASSPTRSIAWAIADICKSTYGGKLQDARINLQGLYDLDQVWTARGDTFNAVFDSQSTVMEALTLAARAGRAVPFVQGGIVHVVRDQPATLPTAMFTQRNIIKNSLNIEYLMASEDTADCIDVTYFDENVWSERTVRAKLPGSAEINPAKMSMFGVTNRQQAWQEGMYSAACNRYRRRLPMFATEMEGFIPTICDLIGLQHDMPKWGQSGEIVAWNPTTKEAILSEPLDWSLFGAKSFAFRGRDGSPQGPFVATAGADAYRVILSDWALSGEYWNDGITDKHTPDTGGNRERSHFAFGLTNEQYIKCRLVAMRPKSSTTVEIAAVVESDYVHEADTGTAPGVTAWQLPTKYTYPVVTGLTARSMPGAPDKMVISWRPAAGAVSYPVEISSGDGSWTRVGESTAANFSCTALYGAATMVRVAAYGVTLGPWVTVGYGSLADYMWSGGSSLMWAGDTETMWRY